MKAPAFWYDQPSEKSPLKTLLRPISRAYAFFATRHRTQSDPDIASIPVICIGNITVGGNGKTPCAITIMNLLAREKIFITPYFLTRGYGGRIQGPEIVDDAKDPAIWGDESILLARYAPTIVSASRYQGAMFAAHQGSDAVILDDGLQHYSLKKTLSFCVIDGATGLGNGEVIPAGPLRQNLQEGLDLADAFIIIGDDLRNVKSLLPQKPVFRADIVPNPEHVAKLKGPYIAFCGIGIPDKFKHTLEGLNIDLVGWKTFSDHHHYTQADLAKLLSEADEKKARLITTEKDYVRLPDIYGKDKIDILPVQIKFPYERDFITYLTDKLV